MPPALADLLLAIERTVAPHLADGVLEDMVALGVHEWTQLAGTLVVSYLGVRAIAAPPTGVQSCNTPTEPSS